MKNLPPQKTDGLQGIHFARLPRPVHLTTGQPNPRRQGILNMRRLGSVAPVPPKRQGRRLLLTVHPAGLIRPLLYGTDSFETIPSIKTLQKIGVDFDPNRGDRLTIDEVSPELFSATPHIWVRPAAPDELTPKKERSLKKVTQELARGKAGVKFLLKDTSRLRPAHLAIVLKAARKHGINPA